jgi:hypothetical protein
LLAHGNQGIEGSWNIIPWQKTRMTEIDDAAVKRKTTQGQCLLDMLDCGDSASNDRVALSLQAVGLGLRRKIKEVYNIVVTGWASAGISDQDEVCR